MAFQQLFYTSCEQGLSGHAGYQFNAVTPGVAATVMREVEHLTVYQAPASVSDAADAAGYPVILCRATDSATGSVITARVVPVGADFSGRPGNYFAHAIVTRDPVEDFGPLLAVELWDAPIWSSRQADGTSLPELACPPPRGDLDRARVAAFLATQPASNVLPMLVSAAWRAVEGGPPVLFTGRDTTANAHWIAAVSYLLDRSLADRISFTTYSHRPDYSRLHLIGTVPQTGLNIAGLTDAFAVFDLTDRPIAADAPVHPVARLVCVMGVTAAQALWTQARLLADGTERSLDAWYPVVAAAAGLAGLELTGADARAVAGWVPAAAARLPAAYIEAVAGVVADRHAADMPDETLAELLDALASIGAADPLRRVEEALIARALDAFAAERVPAPRFRPVTQAGRDRAAQGLTTLLERADAERALSMLAWAANSGVDLPADAAEHWGRQMLGPNLMSVDDPTEKIAMAAPAVQTALRRGLIGYLNGLPELEVFDKFHKLADGLLRPEHFNDHPELRELWTVSRAHANERDRVETLIEVVDHRRRRRHRLPIDERLLRLIWLNRPWSAGEARRILHQLGPDCGPDSGVPDWLAEVIIAEPSRGDIGDWLNLIARLAETWPPGQLPRGAAAKVQEFQRVTDWLRSAEAAVPEGDETALTRLQQYEKSGSGVMSDYVRERMAQILLTAPDLPNALTRCSWPVFRIFCAHAVNLLDPASQRHSAAAALFIAMRELSAQGRYERADLLNDQVLRPALGLWRARDLKVVRRILHEQHQALASAFDLWCSQQKGLAHRALSAAPRQAWRVVSSASRLVTGRPLEPPGADVPRERG